ncbi:MAG: ethanolamine ammonia-lyase subunit EutC [Rubrivivax sp.]
MSDAAVPDPWFELRRHTAARIALGRAGNSLPTAEWLRFAEAHALARDAVHTALQVDGLMEALRTHGFGEPVVLESAAPDRATYLRRPDLGRRLSARSDALLQAAGPGPACELAVVLADGLSAAAVDAHALPLLLALRPRLEADGVIVGPVAVARQARVALGDAIGALLQARAVLVLIGERPGLSSPHSLGAYLTWAPRVGRSDAERNCVSNIRPEGLQPAAAARTLAWLLAGARRLGATGVTLKDECPHDGLSVLAVAKVAGCADRLAAPDARQSER